MTDINEILKERGSRYGEFPDHARISQNIKRAMQRAPKWEFLEDDQKECLEMVAHKIARVLNGDPNYKDNYVDLLGYVQLVLNRLNAEFPEA